MEFPEVGLCHVLLVSNAPTFLVLLWEPQRQVILRQSLQLDPMSVPALIWPHQPLVRTRSSPASTSLPPPHPPSSISSLSLSSPTADVQLRFTTGEWLVFENVEKKKKKAVNVSTC